MSYQFDNTQVTIVDDISGNGLSFTKDGKSFEITQQAYVWDKDTYRASLNCDGEYFGYVVWKIIDRECEDESNACDWDKFDVYA